MNFEEYSERLDRKVCSFNVAQMNNTKWREVIEILADEAVEVRYSTVWSNRLSCWHIIDAPKLNELYVSDGAFVGGPLIYKELHTLEIARCKQRRDPRTGAFVNDDSASLRVLERLSKLGSLPIESDENVIRIIGYL